MGETRRVNRLADATSPYLLQHADNPVDWWEWGPDAFAAKGQHTVHWTTWRKSQPRSGTRLATSTVG